MDQDGYSEYFGSDSDSNSEEADVLSPSESLGKSDKKSTPKTQAPREDSETSSYTKAESKTNDISEDTLESEEHISGRENGSVKRIIMKTYPKLSNEQIILTKIPNFLGIQYDEFDRNKWIEALCQEETVEEGQFLKDNLMKIENTARWRYTKDGSGAKESNVRLIRWSDNSYTLVVGLQHLETTVTRGPEHQYIGIINEKSKDIIKLYSKVNDVVAFHSDVLDQKFHKELTRIIVSKHEKKAKTQGFFVLQDPEKKIAELEKIEAEKERSERIIRAKRQRLKNSSSSSFRKGFASNYEDKDGDYYHSDEQDQDDAKNRERIMRAKYERNTIPREVQASQNTKETNSSRDWSPDKDNSENEDLSDEISRRRRKRRISMGTEEN